MSVEEHYSRQKAALQRHPTIQRSRDQRRGVGGLDKAGRKFSDLVFLFFPINHSLEPTSKKTSPPPLHASLAASLPCFFFFVFFFPSPIHPLFLCSPNLLISKSPSSHVDIRLSFHSSLSLQRLRRFRIFSVRHREAMSLVHEMCCGRNKQPTRRAT